MTMDSLDRGFKSWAERTAGALRRELDLNPLSPVDPLQLAALLGIEVCTPRDLGDLPPDVCDQLLEVDPFGWSAVSIATDGGGLIIYNPRKSQGRRASDIMHELAHILLDHKPSTIVLAQDLDLAMRSFDAKQEDEANCLAWAVLLPREVLLACIRGRANVATIAERYGVTETLVTYRLNITGVVHQIRAGRKRS